MFMIILTTVNKTDKLKFINNIKYVYKNYIVYHWFFIFEINKFKYYYIKYFYDATLYRIEYYNYLHDLYREDGPALTLYDKNGKNYIINQII